MSHHRPHQTPHPPPHGTYRPIAYTNPTTEIYVVGHYDAPVARIDGFVPLPIDADVVFYDHETPTRWPGGLESPGFRGTVVRRHILVLQNGEVTLQLYVE